MTKRWDAKVGQVSRTKGYGQYALGGLLFILSLGFTVWLGVLGSTDEPLTRSTAALVVLLAGVFQVAGGSAVHSVGKADPGLARAAVRRLLAQARRASEAEALAQQAYEQGSGSELRHAMGNISVHLSYLEEGAIEAIADWHDVHDKALEQLMVREPDDESD